MTWNVRYFRYGILSLLLLSVISANSCSDMASTDSTSESATSEQTQKIVPCIDRWSIYALDIATEEVELLYSSAYKISYLDLNRSGDTLAFSQQFAGETNENEEICTLDVSGGDVTRLTDNNLWDIYPIWSPDGSQIAFLSLRDKDLDIYVMEQNGSNQRKLYDSGNHDADIDWVGNQIAFTARSRIWIMREDGTGPTQVTEPHDAGLWGNANLPFGDYDPRLSPDGSKIAFERLEDDKSSHGNYNIYIIDTDGSDEIRLTDSGYSQGIVSWSHSGDKMVFVVAAIGSEAKYDIYMINSDGSSVTNITPGYFPPNFLCHTPIYSIDDSKIFFIGEWWE